MQKNKSVSTVLYAFSIQALLSLLTPAPLLPYTGANQR